MKLPGTLLVLLAMTALFGGGAAKETAPAIVFTEDLRFGADEGRDAYIWSLASTSVSVDDRGFMYVTDPKENRVLEFDPKGAFVRLVAKQGQGPGEFQDLFRFQILVDGSALGYELINGSVAKLQRFDQHLVYRDSLQKVLILESVTLSPRGDLIGGFFVEFDSDSRRMSYRTAVLDSRLEIQKTFSHETGSLPDRSRFSQPGYWAQRIGANIKRALKGYAVFNFSKDGTLYSATTDRYEVTRWSHDLKTARKVFKREYEPVPNSEEQLAALVESLVEEVQADPVLADLITPAVLKRAVAIADPPKLKNPIFGLLLTEEDLLLVVRDVDLVSRRNRAEVFSPEGAYLGVASVENHGFLRPAGGSYLPRMVFKNGFAYTVETDAFGDNRVVRYRYRVGRGNSK